MQSLLGKHRTLLSLAWLVFTVSLGIWWFYLALSNTDELINLTRQLGEADHLQELSRYARQRNMIQLEGIVFLAMLFSGGVILIWMVHRDNKRHRLIQDFFSTLTHEMKTPLTSLQLQVESLLEDSQDKELQARLKKVLDQNNRIGIQMSKAFYLASLMRSEQLYIENFRLEPLLQELHWDWPQLELTPPLHYVVRADRRALDSILKNVFDNAVQHGEADRIKITASPLEGQIQLQIQDNGRGFPGQIQQLGQAFIRHGRSSGSGIGIYIIKSLLTKMQARVTFKNLQDEENGPVKGFGVTMLLPVAKSDTVAEERGRR
ncbi:MAG: HAMP domain-containing histidine kinase [Leptospiraceae bacterium]|nr:HAMP domain-containing histidine kinase [Leptospiraceae bacterium]